MHILIYAPLSGKEPANDLFNQELTKWVFQESRVLRIASVEHHRASDTPPSATLNASAPRESYTTNDQIVRRSVCNAHDCLLMHLTTLDVYPQA